MQFRNLRAQYKRLKPEIDIAIAEVLDNAQFIGGKTVERLEAKLAEYVGVKHCISCANGTDALEISLKALGIGHGDAVFVPDFTFFATAEAVSTVGATPIFVDVYFDTFNISVEDLEAAIEKVLFKKELRPSAILPVNLFGLPANYIRLREVAERCNLFILEDAAQGFGGRIGEHRAGSFGDIATTSFFPAKPLGCYGDGGAVFTNSDQWAEYIRSFCLHGKGTTKYDNIRIGRNSRLDTIQAAILEVKLKSFIEYELEAINKVASIYSDALINRFDCPFIPSGYYSSFAQYTIKLKDGQERERLINKLASKGIPSMVYYPIPLHRQGAYKGMMRRDDDYPVSEKLAQTVLSLPIDPDMTENDVMAVVAAFSENEVVK